MELRSTKLYQSPIALQGLELFLDNTFLIDPSLLKQLKNHIDINYGEKGTDGDWRTEQFRDTESQTLDLILSKFLRNALLLNYNR